MIDTTHDPRPRSSVSGPHHHEHGPRTRTRERRGIRGTGRPAAKSGFFGDFKGKTNCGPRGTRATDHKALEPRAGGVPYPFLKEVTPLEALHRSLTGSGNVTKGLGNAEIRICQISQLEPSKALG
jgi:hypothetical protein